MRETKFRAWNETDKKMVGWNELLQQNIRNIFISPKDCGYNLMQFTGHKDKNGIGIYEGDIVRHYYFKNWVGEIKWNDKNASFQLKRVSSSSMTHLNCYEVIGNIYENPELPEGGENE